MKPALTLLAGEFSVCRLAPGTPMPGEPDRASFWSAARTADELSVVTPAGTEPGGARVEMGWRVFKAEGPMAFSELGVLAGITGALSSAGVSIFAISTFDTDYILFKGEQLTAALEGLLAAGYVVKG